MELHRRLFPLSVLAVLCGGTLPGAQRSELRPACIALDLAPFGARTRANTSGLESAPILAGEFLLVSSPRRLLALDAPTGALACWSTPALPGWDALRPEDRDSLHKGVNLAGLLVHAAAGEHVAVASLQLPLSRARDEDWQGIPLTVALPERRLFAFELASGRPLWNHAPSGDWDGATGPFEQRMNLIAAPLVVGERVLVACTRDESSIDYHVACYALGTGRLQWTTFIARGQMERNMFGCQVREFAAAPLVATPDGSLGIAQTGLGRIAALDLGSGEIRWQFEYEPIPLPKVKSYSPPVRRARWRTTAPLVSDGLVLATPRDSEELLVLDLATGETRGSLTKEWLLELEAGFQSKAGEVLIDHLVGARGDRLYLGGERLLVLERSGGFGSEAPLKAALKTPLQAPWTVAWSRRIDAPTAARAQLVGERLFVADGLELHELDARDGSPQHSYRVEMPASFLVTDEAVFTLGRNCLTRLPR